MNTPSNLNTNNINIETIQFENNMNMPKVDNQKIKRYLNLRYTEESIQDVSEEDDYSEYFQDGFHENQDEGNDSASEKK